MLNDRLPMRPSCFMRHARLCLCQSGLPRSRDGAHHSLRALAPSKCIAHMHMCHWPWGCVWMCHALRLACDAPLVLLAGAGAGPGWGCAWGRAVGPWPGEEFAPRPPHHPGLQPWAPRLRDAIQQPSSIAAGSRYATQLQGAAAHPSSFQLC